MVAKTPSQDGQQVGPCTSDLVEDGQRTHEPTHPTSLSRPDAEEGKQVARVTVRGQLGAVPVGPGMGVDVGDVDDVAQAFTHHALGDSGSEAQPDAPEHLAQLVDRAPVHREASEESQPPSVQDLVSQFIHQRPKRS